MDSRKNAGLWVLIFMIAATVLAYLAYQNIWYGPTSRRVRQTGVLDPENRAKTEGAKSEAGIEG